MDGADSASGPRRAPLSVYEILSTPARPEPDIIAGGGAFAVFAGRTAESHRVPGFTHEEARPIHDDGLRHAVEGEHANPATLPAGSYLIRLHLENAEAFALTIR